MPHIETKRRRRWPWILLAIGLLLVGGPFALQLRPLNPTERALVGTWSEPAHGIRYRLTADRQVEMSNLSQAWTSTGQWSASGDSLSLSPGTSAHIVAKRPWYLNLPFSLLRPFARRTYPLRLDGRDRIWLGGVEFVRVPD